jgi:transcription initiation factor IIE alpha subunit
MIGINTNLLSDTLNVVQIAQETSLRRGNEVQANKMQPVVDKLRSILTKERSAAPIEPSSELKESSFKTLMALKEQNLDGLISSKMPVEEKHQIVTALASGGMSETDIAKQLGVARDEVRMIVNLSEMNSTTWRSV